MSYFLSVNTPPSTPGLNVSVQLTGRPSGFIGIVDMFGFENSQVRHTSTIEVVNGRSKTRSLASRVPNFRHLKVLIFFQKVVLEPQFFERLSLES